MGEKSASSTTFLIALFSISTLLLLSSSITLFRYDDIPLIRTSVFNLLDSCEPHTFDNPPQGQPPPFEFEDEDTNVLLPEEETLLSNQQLDVCDPNRARLRVYMYDMPPYFHFGLLGWKGKDNQTWPDVSNSSEVPPYPGGLNKQHSVEYWLTLDLLASNKKSIVRPCTCIRVHNITQADVVFVPFFASLSYNRHSKTRAHGNEMVSLDKALQKQLVQFLMSKSEWKRHGGKDHLIVPHHPNSLLYARNQLGSARFVLADFGRYPSKVANLDKDVIAPYKYVVRTVDGNDSAPYEKRPILAYFQGAIHRKDGGAIREKLYNLMKDEKDVHFTSGSLSQRNGARQAGQGMGSSKFCLNIAGDTPSSNRLFDAIMSHCIPVIISDTIELPSEDVLDYSEFSVFVFSSDAMKPRFLVNLLRGIGRDEWTKMWMRVKVVAPHFTYQFPSETDDAVDMIWQAVARKLSTTSNHHRKRNYRRPNGVLEEWPGRGRKYTD